MGQQFLDGHPVVKYFLIPLFHHLFVAEFDDVGLLFVLCAGELFQTIGSALFHELAALPLLLGANCVLLPLFLAPVAAHLQLTDGVIVCGHAAALLVDPKGAFSQQLVPDRPLCDVARAVAADLHLPLHLGLQVTGANGVSAHADQTHLTLGVLNS